MRRAAHVGEPSGKSSDDPCMSLDTCVGGGLAAGGVACRLPNFGLLRFQASGRRFGGVGRSLGVAGFADW